MLTFVLRLIAPRPGFARTMTGAEREIMSRHAAHWRPYLERGDMVVFGPVLTDDDSYGLAVVQTSADADRRAAPRSPGRGSVAGEEDPSLIVPLIQRAEPEGAARA